MVSFYLSPKRCAQCRAFNITGNVVELWEFDSGGDGGIPRTVCFGDKGREVKVYHLETGMQ